MRKAQPGTELSPNKTAQIAAFLDTLTGDTSRVFLPAFPPSDAKTAKPQD